MPVNNSFEFLKNISVLVVDDEEVLVWSIEKELKQHGADVVKAHTAREARQQFRENRPDVIVCDIRLPDGDGLELLEEWRQQGADLPVIMMTAHGAVDSAVSAVRLSAFDYLQKPFNLKDLLVAVRRASEISHLRQRVSRIEGAVSKRQPIKIIGESPCIRKLRMLIERVAKSNAETVLIHGETGSGKELVAHALHDLSKHSTEPFVEINCASIPETLLESELFGHEKGAFTDARARKLGLFEIAKSGTLFLDEIGEMPLKLQSKLLRAIEQRRFKRLGGTKDVEFKARIVAATNRDLLEEISYRNFRADLYYRLNVIPLTVPSLRERTEDIPLLVDFFLEKYSAIYNVDFPDIDAEAIEHLASHRWPGNVRELINTLQKILVLESPLVIGKKHIQLERYIAPREPMVADHADNVVDFPCRPENCTKTIGEFVFPDEGLSLEKLEKDLLNQALLKAHYNQSKAAELLKITRHTLRYRLEKYGLLEK